jgi:hypothetical protein
VRRALPLLCALILAGAGVFFLFRPSPRQVYPVHGALARAQAYYLNENSADCRRARLELEAVADRFTNSVAYHVDFALIDLQEANYLAEADDRHLLRSAANHLEYARRLDSKSEAVSYNLARTFLKAGERSLAEALLRPLAARQPADPASLLLCGNLLWDRGETPRPLRPGGSRSTSSSPRSRSRPRPPSSAADTPCGSLSPKRR